MIKIYTLKDPTTNEIKYVGKTSQSLKRRLSLHLSVARNRIHISHTSNWIKSLLDNNQYPLIEELDFIEDEDWEWLEQYWISQLKQWGFKLTNQTDGGVGNVRQKSLKNTKRGSWLIGKRRSKEACNNISKGLKELYRRRSYSEEGRLKIQKTVTELQGKKVVQMDLKTREYIKTFSSRNEAARAMKIDSATIYRCCIGKFKSAAGFFWMYYDDYIEDMTQSNGNVDGETDDE